MRYISFRSAETKRARRIRLATAVIGVLGSSLSSSVVLAQRPSFDCAKATTPDERLICGSPDLSRVDGELDRAYRSARDRMGEADRKQLISAQREWIRRRNLDCGITRTTQVTDANRSGFEKCLERQYLDRIVILSQPFPGDQPPAQTAAGPSRSNPALVVPDSSGPAGRSVLELPCTAVNSIALQQSSWRPGSKPFGIPFEMWDEPVFAALTARYRACAAASGERRETTEAAIGHIQQRQQAKLAADAVAKESARRLEQGRLAAEEAARQEQARRELQARQLAEEDARMREEQAARQAQWAREAAQAEQARKSEAARRQAEEQKERQWEMERPKRLEKVRAEGEAAFVANQSKIQPLQIPQSLLRSEIILMFGGESARYLTLAQWLGYVAQNPAAMILGVRKWDQQGVKGLEVAVKLTGKPSGGILFKPDGPELFVTHFVVDDVAEQAPEINVGPVLGAFAGRPQSDLLDFRLSN